MKSILVPFDFSKRANDAYDVAIDIASRTKGKILLVHILTAPMQYTTGFADGAIIYDPEFFRQMEEDIHKELVSMKKKAEANSISVTTEVLQGELVSSVKTLIETRNVDLVVMGTSGSSGLTEFFIGSNTEKVVRFSPVPVLAVRQAIDIRSVKNILLPSTLNLNQNNFMKKLKELQQFFDATLHVLFVNTPGTFRNDKEAKEVLEEFAKHYQLTNYKLHFRNHFYEEDGIIDFVHSEKMDLIAMATHARKGLSHLFNASLTESVVNHIQSPIWTYHLAH